jgi:DNA-binding transcriptional ArsR family regulator
VTDQLGRSVTEPLGRATVRHPDGKKECLRMPPDKKRTPKTAASERAAKAASAERSLEQAVQFFDLLSDATRLRILLLLDREGKMTATELSTPLGISQSGTSHQLNFLRLGGLVEPDRSGIHVYYRLASKAVRKLLRLACRRAEREENQGKC